MRVTQRAPQSCVQCTSRKLRCSKQIPCKNCMDRGTAEQCHREAVILTDRQHSRSSGSRRIRRREPSSMPVRQDSHRPEAVSVSSLQQPQDRAPRTPESSSSIAGGSLVAHAIRWRRGQELDVDDRITNQPVALRITSESAGGDSTHNDKQMSATKGGLAIEAAMSLESLAWGHYRGLPESVSDQADISNLPDLLNNLITIQQAESILKFHQEHVTWMHNVIYMPFFLRECQDLHSGSNQQSTGWLSLYYAVICTGIYYMNEEQHRSLGLNDSYHICQKFYQLTIETLTKSNFMVIHSLCSVQAICVILICAYSLGDAKRIVVLLASANCVAQTLHLHRIDAEPPGATSRHELIDREVRKRVWCFLCTQDWYLIASKRSYFISPNHMTTALPLNCSEDDMGTISEGAFLDLPLSTPTQSTYMIYLYKFTRLFQSLHDKLSSLEMKGGTVSDLFDEVLKADERIVHITREMPDWTRQSKPASLSWPSYVLWQRRSLLIVCWHQRLMIHRPFFCRSFHDKRYYYSRAASLQASRAIMKDYYTYADQQAVDTWTMPAHVISGCMIATLNMMFSGEDSETTDSDMDLMHNCLQLLQRSRRPSTIVNRGIGVIEHLLQQDPNQQYRSLDIKELARLIREVNLIHVSPAPGVIGSEVVAQSPSQSLQPEAQAQMFELPLNFNQVPIFDDYVGSFAYESSLHDFSW